MSTTANPWKAWKKLPPHKQLERAHREVLRELPICIPWAPPEVARELRRRYRVAYHAALLRPEQLEQLEQLLRAEQ